MNKSLFLFAMSIMLLGAGCKKEYIVPNRTIFATLSPGNWIKLDGGRSYTASISMPEISNNFNEYGAVLVYISFENGVYEQIPQVYNGVSYSYVSRSGKIVLEIQSSDGLGTVTPPGSVKVKIILIESI